MDVYVKQAHRVKNRADGEEPRMIVKLCEFGNVGEWKLYLGRGTATFVSAVFHISTREVPEIILIYDGGHPI